MATQADARRIALSLPGITQEGSYFSFGFDDAKGKRKRICWVWRERIHPKKARVPNPKVLGVRVADENDKVALLGADPDKFFTEPHYDGYPAILVRLANVSVAELRTLLLEAHRCQTLQAKPKQKSAPKRRKRAR